MSSGFIDYYSPFVAEARLTEDVSRINFYWFTTNFVNLNHHVSVPLLHDKKIVCHCWVRNSELKDKILKTNEGNNTCSALKDDLGEIFFVTALNNGDILIFSPLKDEVIERIPTNYKFISITRSFSGSDIMFLTQRSRSLQEFSLTLKKGTKKLSFGVDKIRQIRPLVTDADTHKLILCSSKLYLMRITNGNEILVNEIKQNDENKYISSTKQLSLNKNYILVSKEGSSTIDVFDIRDLKNSLTIKVPSIINSIGSVVNSITSTEYIVVATDLQIQAFEFPTKGVNHPKPAFVITPSETHNNITFVNLFETDGELIVAFIENDQLNFSMIEWKNKMAQFISVPPVLGKSSIPQRQSQLSKEKSLVENILNLLKDKNLNDEELLKNCFACEDEDTVKNVIRLLPISELDREAPVLLFEKIGKCICNHPLSPSPASIWLKWLLLFHGAHIGRTSEQNENLLVLQKKLTEGMKLLPLLYGIQGRLQLLKSQTELRNRLNIFHGNNGFQTNEDPEDITIINGEGEYGSDREPENIEESDELEIAS